MIPGSCYIVSLVMPVNVLITVVAYLGKLLKVERCLFSLLFSSPFLFFLSTGEPYIHITIIENISFRVFCQIFQKKNFLRPTSLSITYLTKRTQDRPSSL
jgi:hypothetical protein